MADWTAVERCRKPQGFGRRHLLAILGFAGFALSYAMRFCLSIAIVAMVNNRAVVVGKPPSPHNDFIPSVSTLQLPHNNSLQRNSVLFKSDICPHDRTSHATLDLKLNLYHNIETSLVDTGSKNSESFEVISGTVNNYLLQTTPAAQHSNDSLNEPLKTHSEATTASAVATVQPGIKIVTSFKTVDEKDDSEEEDQGEFFWNEKEQGLILGSFFWGYVLTQCFGGWISQKIGGKWPFGIGILITGLFAVVTPAAARLGGMPAILIVRIIQGLAGGVTVPSMQAILSKWFPAEERGKLGSFTLAGMPFGTFTSTLCSGFLIHYFGWSSVFYVTGIMAVLWFIVWSCCAYASPLDDPLIGQSELQYIQTALKQHSFTKSNNAAGSNGVYQRQPVTKVDVPWCRVLLSPPFWAILVCNTCETWGLYTINAELPTYMKTVLHFDIKQNSVISAFPHLLSLIVSVILTNVGDTLIARQHMSIGIVRKLSTSIAMWGSAAALVAVAYSGCDRLKTVALLATAISCNGGKFGGFLVNIIDIAPNYAGILMGVINTISSMPGFFAPWVAGMIINDNPSLGNWRLVFLITAAISFFGNLVFILCASGVEQPWNHGDGRGTNGGSSCGIDTTLQSTPSSPECINQAILLNKAVKNSNKTKECGNNGVYIIPLNPVEVAEQQHHGEAHQRGVLPVPVLPLIAVHNVHQDVEEDPGDEKSGLRCSA